jgi:hypothetical protein
MKTVNVMNPDGNVFCILGYAKDFQSQLKKSNIKNDILDDVLKNYTSMNYNGILDKLESTHLFKFTGRKKKP